MTLINPSESNEKSQSSPKSSNQSNQDNKSPDGGSEWGYDLYPERRQQTQTTGLSALFKGKGIENIDKARCERNVYKCIKQSPIIKLMMGALRSSGCSIDIRRHISCEQCAPMVSGGYDPILNQVVICQNVVKKQGLVQAVLTHEMIHMFDFCKHQLDFKNLNHLACTEIRAANLAHCSFLSAWTEGDASLFNIKQTHQNCVKNKALSSMLAARNVSKDDAMQAIERVFDQCYNDLEPIGRRLRRNSQDMFKAYEEGYYYGYEYN